jgi:phage FluMu protein Com
MELMRAQNVQMWMKLWCPRCETVNWLSMGDPDDVTGVDTDVVICRKCHQKIALIDEEDMMGDPVEDYGMEKAMP